MKISSSWHLNMPDGTITHQCPLFQSWSASSCSALTGHWDWRWGTVPAEQITTLEPSVRMVWSFTAVLGPEIWSSQVDYMPPEAWLETQWKKKITRLYIMTSPVLSGLHQLHLVLLKNFGFHPLLSVSSSGSLIWYLVKSWKFPTNPKPVRCGDASGPLRPPFHYWWG